MKKHFAIGDIHGCVDQLKDMLPKLNMQNEDVIIFLGDYIDRGPHSKEVIQYLIDLNVPGEKIFLRGNHEDMMIRAMSGDDMFNDLWMYNGGVETINSYEINGRAEIPKEHIDFINNTKIYHETDEYVFVHAGCDLAVPLLDQKGHDLMWVRGEFINNKYPWNKIVVFGHTPQTEPLIMNNKIGIDTGCVFGGMLTCVELPGIKFHQVMNRK